MPKNTLSITDNRTGKAYEVPITDGSVRAMDLRQIKVDAEDFGVMTYDPAFTNTASCRSSITYIDGDKGILEYRGYPIEQLAESSTYLEVAYLLINGELPTQKQLDDWVFEITHYGPRNLLLVGGVGYSPLIDNVDLHARAILPVTDRVAVQLIAAHNSINADTRVTAGLRFTW